MSKSNSWRQAYTELTHFIAEHPKVEIGARSVSIPEYVRPEFYRLLNMVRKALMEEKFPILFNKATALSENYLKVEQEVNELLGLEDVSAVANLRRFLYDPVDELRRGLFDPLFDLLKGKLGIETFEEVASRNIEASFEPLYRLGYEKWVALSLVKSLNADRLFQVIVERVSSREKLQIKERRTGTPTREVPSPEESKRLLFKYKEDDATFTVPDLIVHSAKVDGYIAVRSQISEALATVSNASEKREWYPLNSIVTLESGLTLIYVADNLEEISLVADARTICRPDLIMECREQKDWYEREGLEKVKLHHDNLKPRLGTYIVSKEPVPKQAYKELMSEESVEPISGEEQSEQETAKRAGVNILTVGFDQSRLEPIIRKLTSRWSPNES